MFKFVDWLNEKFQREKNYPVHAAIAMTKGPNKADLDSNYYMYPQQFFSYREQMSILEEEHTETKMSDYLPKGYGFFAICDGMTNYRGSVYASHAVVSRLEEALKESLEDSSYSVDDIRKLLEQINKEICNYAEENPSIEHMACSLSGLWVTPDTIRTINIGNSSIWRFLDGHLTRLTRAHLRGSEGMPYFTNDSALPEKNPLYSYMGIHNDEGVLVIDIDEVSELCEKEWFLLINEHLLQFLSIEEIESILSKYYESDSPLDAVNTLITTAKQSKIEKETIDDLICMVVSVGQESESQEKEIKGEI
jgi:serine/threonine protein phosphatase PrpC